MNNGYSLWLPAWYPNPTEALSGDFIQRHANAVADQMKIVLLYVVKDPSLDAASVKVNIVTTKNLTEHIGIYNSIKGNNLLCRLISFSFYCYFIFGLAKKIFKKEGKPVSVHVHVAGRNAFIALLISRIYGVPLYYSEHASVFLPEAKNSLHQKFWKRQAWIFFANKCCNVSAVSNHLAQNMNILGYSKPVLRIPNVVDPEIFHPDFKSEHTQNPVLRLLHISNLGYEKNIEVVLQVLSELKEEEVLFQLDIYGPADNKKQQQLLKNLGLEDFVFFKGEVSHREIADVMREADFLLAYSKLETFGCVVAEALYSGLPVIVSDYPSLQELVTEGVNGWIVTLQSPNDLRAILNKEANTNTHMHFEVSDFKKMKDLTPKNVSQSFMNFYQLTL